MPISQSLLPEMKQEGASTRRMLEAVPFDNPGWKPHEKSMNLQHLAHHLAELTGWTSMIIHSNDYDFAKTSEQQAPPANKEELLKLYDDTLARAIKDVENVTDETLMTNWSLRNGETIYFTLPKVSMLRINMNHIIHHRGQLSVYLRLNNIKVPGVYGPTADDPKM